MKRTPTIRRCTLAADGIEVVTYCAPEGHVVEIHGGALDGERFICRGPDVDEEVRHACKLASRFSWHEVDLGENGGG